MKANKDGVRVTVTGRGGKDEARDQTSLWRPTSVSALQASNKNKFFLLLLEMW